MYVSCVLEIKDSDMTMASSPRRVKLTDFVANSLRYQDFNWFFYLFSIFLAFIAVMSVYMQQCLSNL